MNERSPADTVQLKVRMKEPLRAQLEKAAEAKGVSLNAEAVSRLERSFEEDDQLGGPEQANLFRAMAAIAATLEGQQKKKWTDDFVLAQTVAAAWQALLARTVQHRPSVPLGLTEEEVVLAPEAVRATLGNLDRVEKILMDLSTDSQSTVALDTALNVSALADELLYGAEAGDENWAQVVRDRRGRLKAARAILDAARATGALTAIETIKKS